MKIDSRNEREKKMRRMRDLKATPPEFDALNNNLQNLMPFLREKDITLNGRNSLAREDLFLSISLTAEACNVRETEGS
jgi:hypothetical protein